MKPEIVAFAGLPGAGKTTLSRAFADALGLPHATFANEVRRIAANERGLTNPSRRDLQELGQELATKRTKEFCRAVLVRSGKKEGTTLVLDGLRHVEVLRQLRDLVGDVILVYVNSALDDRASRTGLSRAQEIEIEGHQVESQSTHLKELADYIVDTSSRSLEESLADVLAWLSA